MKPVSVALFAGIVVCSFNLMMPVADVAKEKMLHSFARGSADGAMPEASLINVKGMLYCTTPISGSNGQGTGVCGHTLTSMD